MKLETIKKIENFFYYIYIKLVTFITLNLTNCIKEDDIILFTFNSEYIGFKVESSDKYVTRTLVWFYKQYDVPTINDWLIYLSVFNFKNVPSHDIYYTPNNDKITIEDINIYNITLTMDDITVNMPTSVRKLVPASYIINFKNTLDL
jgi:hypothetical protein